MTSLFQLLLLAASLYLLTWGCSMAWKPLGPIVLGSLLLTGVVWVRMRTISTKER